MIWYRLFVLLFGLSALTYQKLRLLQPGTIFTFYSVCSKISPSHLNQQPTYSVWTRILPSLYVQNLHKEWMGLMISTGWRQTGCCKPVCIGRAFEQKILCIGYHGDKVSINVRKVIHSTSDMTRFCSSSSRCRYCFAYTP